jgi:cellobiose phosphorylase
MDRWVAKARRNLSAGRPPRRGLTAEQVSLLEMRYSHFEDQRDGDGFLVGSEHVVTALQTPRPYIHLMASNHDEEFGVFGSFWDPTGLGFCCLDSVLAGPVTSHKDASYVPTAPRRSDVRLFYLREQTRGGADIWFMLPQIDREADEYESVLCRQGLGYAVYESTRKRLATRLRVFVPVDDPCEVWTITLTNRSRRRRLLLLFAVNWGLETHPGYYFDPRMCSQGAHEKDLNAILAFNRDKGNTLPRTGFMTADARFAGFDLSNEAFEGPGRLRTWPRAVEQGGCTNSLGRQPYLGLCGALQFNLTLAAGARRTVNVLVGNTAEPRARHRANLRRLRRRYLSGGGVDRQFDRLARSWASMVSAAAVDCPDEELNRTYNVWLKYQQKNCTRMVHALDQVGYRDILQALMGICPFNPRFVRNHLPRVLNYQLRDGRAIRQFFKYPDTHAPNDERMYADSPLWIADTLVTYLEETGDFGFLDVKVGFYDLQTHRRDPGTKASVYEHCRRGIMQAYETRGQRGLCRVGHGDWNDAVDGLSRKGKGVSAWLSAALVFAAQRFGKLARHLGDKPVAAKMDEIVRTMTRNLNRGAWDGDHYVFGYDDAGRVVGSQANDEGRIHLAVNTWALFTGVAAAAGRAEAVEKRLRRMQTPVGPVLLDPPYTHKSRPLVGRIADMAPGQFENGAVYSHPIAFLAYALAGMGRGGEAIEQLKRTWPGNTLPDITTAPTHQQSNYAVGPAHPHHGLKPYTNFTGSTSWYLKALHACVGVVADFEGLRIAPTVPRQWKQYRLRKRFRGVTFEFEFTNASGRCRVRSVVAAGRPMAPDAEGQWFLPIAEFAGKRRVKVKVVM